MIASKQASMQANKQVRNKVASEPELEQAGCTAMKDSRMLRAALLLLYGSSTLATGFSPPIPPTAAALIEPQMEEEFTMTLVFFFMNKGRKCFVTRKGPTTLALRTNK